MGVDVRRGNGSSGGCFVCAGGCWGAVLTERDCFIGTAAMAIALGDGGCAAGIDGMTVYGAG